MLFSLIMKYQTEIKNLNGANNSRRFMFLLKKYNKYSFFESKSGNSNKPLYLHRFQIQIQLTLYFMTIQKQLIIFKSFVGEYFLIPSSISKSCCYRGYQWPGIRKSLMANKWNSCRNIVVVTKRISRQYTRESQRKHNV